MRVPASPFLALAALALLFSFSAPAMADPVKAELDAYAKNHISAMLAKESDTTPVLHKPKDRQGYIASYTRVKPDTTIHTKYTEAPRSMPGILYVGEIRYTRLRYTGVTPAPPEEALNPDNA